MSRRPGLTVIAEVPADGGVSPNQYVPFITAEIRMHWPPLATRDECLGALRSAIREALKEFDEAYEGGPWPTRPTR